MLTTAGGIACGRLLQKRRAPDPHSFIGPGKVQELKALMQAENCSLALFDNELSPSQMRALTAELEARVVDRSGLILDIFAQRAQSREGRLQVQLAQYKYTLPRLTGMWTHLDRETSSGSSPLGSRGTGETQLESDRRIIRHRIDRLEEELKDVRRARATQRSLRQRQGVPVAALVGYTNAGKSTLLNQLTDAGIPANNRLFDTLDTTSRQLHVSDNLDVILSDTVGFIAKLPHHLVDAFRATLEELEYADLLLHVIDASDPNREEHIAVVDRLIAKLAKEGTQVLRCYNKADLVSPEDIPIGEDVVKISAKTGGGMDDLLKAIERTLGHSRHHVTVLLPYSMGGMVETLHSGAQVKNVEYTGDGIEVETVLDPILYGKLREYILKEH